MKNNKIQEIFVFDRLHREFADSALPHLNPPRDNPLTRWLQGDSRFCVVVAPDTDRVYSTVDDVDELIELLRAHTSQGQGLVRPAVCPDVQQRIEGALEFGRLQ